SSGTVSVSWLGLLLFGRSSRPVSSGPLCAGLPPGGTVPPTIVSDEDGGFRHGGATVAAGLPSRVVNGGQASRQGCASGASTCSGQPSRLGCVSGSCTCTSTCTEPP